MDVTKANPMTNEILIEQLKDAPLFDVHKWSDYPEVKAARDALFEQIVQLRKQANPKARIKEPSKLKRHLLPLMIDLYVASIFPNPWRGISSHKPDYQVKSRYRKLFLTYDYMVPLIRDMITLGYIEQRKGYFDQGKQAGMRSRIRATEQLVHMIDDDWFGVQSVIKSQGLFGVFQDDPENKREVVILREAKLDGSKKPAKNMEYTDTRATKLMRTNLQLINDKLRKSRITLHIPNAQYEELQHRLAPGQDREPVDFTRKSLCRIFNGDFKHGGRFYGGWWIGIPKEYRKYININHAMTYEVDFSAHHIRMLYAKAGLQPPEDPYDLEGCPFGREDLKRVFLILINAKNRVSTLRACVDADIKNAKEILVALETHHAPIKSYFYSGMGLALQYEDSVLAEKIMLRMMELGSTVLPVHDSFIVKRGYQDELQQVMEEVFAETYGITPAMKTKPTILVEEGEPVEVQSVSLLSYFETYSKSRNLFGL